MSVIDRLLDQAVNLPEDQRLTLAHRLLVASEPDDSPEIARAWDVEIRARIERYDGGVSKSRPINQVFSALDSRLGS